MQSDTCMQSDRCSRYTFDASPKEQVVGGSIVAAQSDLVRVYEVDDASEEEEEEGVADKDGKQTPVAFFGAPSNIQTLACAGDKIAVGLQNGGVLHLRAAFLAASDTATRK